MSQLAHPLLKASRAGSIVFISLVAGLVNVIIGSVYSAIKAALNQLTKNLACEWVNDNIRTNCVAPWFTKTSLIEEVIFLHSSATFCDRDEEGITVTVTQGWCIHTRHFYGKVYNLFQIFVSALVDWLKL
uniref:Uncharacterized protein n=1 Tax=Lactuca sativa TaxID=4236 RepID=A0A9R1X9Z2_LACSA|nr:hypothetical protein LSAT_V11C500260850 [Lactuca sativa]